MISVSSTFGLIFPPTLTANRSARDAASSLQAEDKTEEDEALRSDYKALRAEHESLKKAHMGLKVEHEVLTQEHLKISRRFDAVFDFMLELKQDVRASELRVKLEQDRMNTHIELLEQSVEVLKKDNVNKETLAEVEKLARFIYENR